MRVSASPVNPIEVMDDDIEWGMIRLFKDKATSLHRFFSEEQHAQLETYLHNFFKLPAAEQRAEVFDHLELVIRDNYWLLPIFHAEKKARFHSSLKGVSIDSFGWVDFSKLWIKEKPQAT